METALVAKSGKSDKRNNANKDKECYYCKKKGHFKKDCRKRIADEKETANTATAKPATGDTAYSFISINGEVNLVKSGKDDFIGDSGTSRHCVNDKHHFLTYTESKTQVSGVNGNGISPGYGMIRGEHGSRPAGTGTRENLKVVTRTRRVYYDGYPW
jgi:hypothetical protein